MEKVRIIMIMTFSETVLKSQSSFQLMITSRVFLINKPLPSEGGGAGWGWSPHFFKLQLSGPCAAPEIRGARPSQTTASEASRIILRN